MPYLTPLDGVEKYRDRKLHQAATRDWGGRVLRQDYVEVPLIDAPPRNLRAAEILAGLHFEDRELLEAATRDRGGS